MEISMLFETQLSVGVHHGKRPHTYYHFINLAKGF